MIEAPLVRGAFENVSHRLQSALMEIRQTEVFSRWLHRLKDPRARARVLVRIRRLSLGHPGDIRPVGGGISELRVDHGPGYRIYLTQVGQEVVLLLAGGDKRTQQRDIAEAKKLASDLGS